MEEISLREIIENLLKHKRLIIIITIICIIGTLIVTDYISNNAMQANAIISINTDEILEGNNPDGTRFNVNSIITPSIIGGAIRDIDAKQNITIDNIRKNLNVSPIVPSDIQEFIDAAKKNGEEYIYFPTEFKITFNFSKAFTEKNAKRVIDNIVDVYQEKFIERYGKIDTVENLLSGLENSRYDYKEQSDLILKQINNMETFLDAKIIDSDNYRSKEMGFSYYDILMSLDILKQNDFGILESYIERFNLSKNSENLITFYEFKIKNLDLEMKKKQAEADATKDLMQNFDQKKSLVIVPGVDNKEFKADESISYYDKLAERAATAAVSSSNIFYDMEYIKTLIDSLQNDETKDIDKDILKTESDDLIKTIKIKMDTLVDKTNNLSDENRDYILNNYITHSSTSKVVININLKLNLAIALVLGLMLGAFIAFFKEYWKNSKLPNTNNI